MYNNLKMVQMHFLLFSILFILLLLYLSAYFPNILREIYFYMDTLSAKKNEVRQFHINVVKLRAAAEVRFLSTL